jgi:hypothetical protein
LRANEISKEIPERHRTIAMLAIGLALTAGAADAQTVLPLQNGRLGLAQTTRWVGDITGASTIYYTNDITVYSDPGSWVPNTQYDEFYSGSSIRHQAWSARNGGALPAPTLPCSGIYIGSEETDANGQFNEQKTAGPSRRWDVWNAFYQKNIDLQVVDGTTNQQVTQVSDWNPITPNSCATFIIGLSENASCLVLQQVCPFSAPDGSGNSSWGVVACGWGSPFANSVPWTWPTMTNQPPGTWGQQGADSWISNQVAGAGFIAPGGTAIADYGAVDAVGVQTVYSIAIAATVTGPGWVEFMGKNLPVERIMHVRFPG